jgi:hypothetical protein
MQGQEAQRKRTLRGSRDGRQMKHILFGHRLRPLLNNLDVTDGHMDDLYTKQNSPKDGGEMQ